MSPTPPRRNRWLIAGGIFAALAVVLIVVMRSPSVPRRMAEAPGSSVEPDPVLPPAMPRQTPQQLAPRPQIVPADLARAVAAVGAFDDGRRVTLDDLSEPIRALLDHARLLLATTPRQHAPGLPMQMPDGRELRLPTDPTRPGAPPPAPLVPGSPAERELARAVDGRLIARTHAINGKLPMPTRGDVVKEILEPDAWFSVPYNPALTNGQALELTNRSLGEYALRLEAADYGSVRLNGGLVVPGRYYHVNGTMTITGDVPVGVVIRPLGVVPSYFDQPVRPPSANG